MVEVKGIVKIGKMMVEIQPDGGNRMYKVKGWEQMQLIKDGYDDE